MKPPVALSLKVFNNPSGELVWRVSGQVRDRRTLERFGLRESRVRKNFRSEAEARAWVRGVELCAVANEQQARGAVTWLTEEQLRDAEMAWRLLGERAGAGVLTRAAKLWVQRGEGGGGALDVAAAVAEYLEALERARRAPRTVANLKSRLRAFVEFSGVSTGADITPQAVGRFLARPVAPVTQRNDRQAVYGFCAWLVRQGRLAANPVGAVPRVAVDWKVPAVLAPAEVKRLLEAAQAVNGGAMLGYFAVAAFAGLRPSEIARLTWAEVDIDGGDRGLWEIRVVRQKVRGGAWRVVPVSENLRNWLLCVRAAGLPLGRWTQKTFQAVCARAGLSAWVPDALRHTFATYWLAQHGDIGRLATIMGNSPAVCQGHYLSLAQRRKADAQEFWRL